MHQTLEIQVPAGTPRTRLEDFLFGYFPHLSRMYLREVVRDSKCVVNGRLENVGFRVRGGDFVEINVDASRETAMRPENVPLDLVFEDEHLVVVNKPAGMLVHPTHRDKSGTLLNALSFHFNAEFETRTTERDRSLAFIRPGLVHRLDRQTSGLIVVAKSTRVHRILSRQFQKKLVEKKYLALVEGIVEKDDGVIDGTIGRYADEKRWDVKEDGKHALTRFSVRERQADTTLLELEPVTGRTNQLRIHCASIRHPIVGDVSRGGRPADRLYLHAWRIAFRHPISNEPIDFESPIDLKI